MDGESGHRWEAELSSGELLACASCSASTVDEHGWKFDFPNIGGVRHVTRPYVGPTPRRMLFEMNIIKLIGGPVFLSLGGDQPRVRLYFANSDDRSSDGRWWSYPAYLDLAPGKQSLMVSVSPAYWSNLNGKTGIEAEQYFLRCARHVTRVGFTFSGMRAMLGGAYTTGGNARCAFRHKVIA